MLFCFWSIRQREGGRVSSESHHHIKTVIANGGRHTCFEMRGGGFGGGEEGGNEVRLVFADLINGATILPLFCLLQMMSISSLI